MNGSLRLFRFAGVGVFLHWTWLLAAWFIVQSRRENYHQPIWALLEYVALFVIVLLHEFGHALACRSVGGKAERIVLWPLGGIAFVQPPQRPGAVLWSIAAGPLVNVVLVPLTLPLTIYFWDRPGDFAEFVRALGIINVVLLVFNLLPIYPLDGGQILQSLLWFVIGRGRSLVVAGVLGIAGAIAGGVWAYSSGSIWIALIAVFAGMQASGAVRLGRAMATIEKLPRRGDFACPRCGASPPMGNLWRCSHCHAPVDAFLTPTVCPYCGQTSDETPCFDCGQFSNPWDWQRPAARPTQRVG
jgi:Zn-dependent protease/DNA-directed RNA polymerase subunit RPC12/RpoP